MIRFPAGIVSPGSSISPRSTWVRPPPVNGEGSPVCPPAGVRKRVVPSAAGASSRKVCSTEKGVGKIRVPFDKFQHGKSGFPGCRA